MRWMLFIRVGVGGFFLGVLVAIGILGVASIIYAIAG